MTRPSEARRCAPWRGSSPRRAARRRTPRRSRARRAPASSASVFITWVCSAEPESIGLMPRARPSSLTCTIRSRPSRRAVSSRKAIISRNFHVVSTCSSGNGGFAGMEGLERQVQHDARILADRIEHDRIAEFGRDLAHDLDRLGFELAQMRREPPLGLGHSRRGIGMCAEQCGIGQRGHSRLAGATIVPQPA